MTELQQFYASKSNSIKLQWTTNRIKTVISLIEEFKSSKALQIKRTSSHYNYANKYDIMDVDAEKILILKRKSHLSLTCDADNIQ